MPGTQPQPSRATTILVVEDDRDTREVLVMLLTVAGYAVLEAATGAAALAVMAAHAPHGILLDLRLPDMDGFTICRHLRAHGYPDLPIVLITADQQRDLARRAHDAGLTTVLPKPFTPDALLERLSRVLASP